ncbi:tigger transposable element-derived protein 1-like [Macrobrachium nipponense]|uniref:tigger transposable element-derived protein 1-like n=1 Tax=Macrobrachium nipponense TaxID=159736 RepID=UPI0030C7F348
MGPKQASANKGSEKKKRMMTIEIKHEIIEKHESGVRVTELARQYGRSTSTICTILKQEDAIKSTKPSKGLTILSQLHSETDTEIDHNLVLRITKINVQATTRLGKHRNPNLIEMEWLLKIWLEDQNQQNVPVRLYFIQKLAMELYKAVVQKRGEGSGSEPFVASRGWYNCFKVRANLHNLKLQGEAAITDKEAAAGFPTCLAEIIRDGGYTADQVCFQYGRDRLIFGSVCPITGVHVQEGSRQHQTSKSRKKRVTVLLGSNASGDFRLKPLLVYLNENHQRHLREFSGLSSLSLGRLTRQPVLCYCFYH